MKNLEAIKERYLRDPVPVRLGGLAANLARVESFSNHDAHYEVVEQLLNESKYFIEWTALDTDPQVCAEMVALQRQLAKWQHDLRSIWAVSEERCRVASQAGIWSKRVLVCSGLLG